MAINSNNEERDPDALGNLGNTTPTETTTNNTPPKTQEWSLDDSTPISRTNAIGETETGQRIERTTENGEKEIIMGFSPPRGGGSAWALAPGTSKLMERETPNGTKEVGVKWVRINEDGTLEQTIKWEPVVNEEGAAAIAAGSLVATNTGGDSGNQTSTENGETDTIDPNEQTNNTDGQETGDSGNIADATLTTDGRSYQEIAQSEQHLEVTRGGHILELPAGNHVIGGVFDDFPTAEELSDKLFHRGLRETIVGYVSARGHYYVVVGSFSSVERAQSAKGRIQSTYSLKDAWVLKVKDK